MLRITLQ